LPELLEDGENGLSDFFRPLLADCYQQLQEIDAHIDFYTQALKCNAQHNEAVDFPAHIRLVALIDLCKSTTYQ
jgi:hypothetical protein